MDDNGIMIGRMFFLVCAFVNLICFFAYKFAARDIWKFMRKYQIKSLEEEPSPMYINIFRVWTFIAFLVFLVQAMMIGK